VFQQWIAEGRVQADSWVWRTGWPEWKPGAEALPLVAPTQARFPAASNLSSATPVVVDPTTAPSPSPAIDAGPSHHESSLAEARRAELKRRKQRVQSISILLGVLALVMAAILAIVLSL
jgi:hypothetical protein